MQTISDFFRLLQRYEVWISAPVCLSNVFAKSSKYLNTISQFHSISVKIYFTDDFI